MSLHQWWSTGGQVNNMIFSVYVFMIEGEVRFLIMMLFYLYAHAIMIEKEIPTDKTLLR